MKTTALVVLVSLTATGAVFAETTVYDLKDDWEDFANPNGVWSYNAGSMPLVPVADLSDTGIDHWDIPQPGFTAQPIFGDITPVWFRSTGPLSNGDPEYEVGDIVTHTSRSFVPNSNVSWTSDLEGEIDISGAVWATRAFGRSNDWFLFLNDVLLTSGTVSDGDPFDRSNPFLFELGSGGAAALQDIPVSVGDVVKLEFQQKFGFGEDYVGVNVTIIGQTTGGVPPDEAIELLVETVMALNMKEGISNALDAKLETALHALDDMNENNDAAAVGSLEALINLLQAQRGKSIDEGDADELIAQAQAIIDAIEAGTNVVV